MSQPAGWDRGTFLVRTVEEPAGVSRDCYVCPQAPGLCVNRRDDLWVVSHIRSGTFVQPAFTRVGDACSFAIAIAPAGDWTRSGRELLDDAALRGRVVIERDRTRFKATGIFLDKIEPSELALDA